MKTRVRQDISLEEIKKREATEKRRIVADRIRAIRLAFEGEYKYTEISKICGRSDRCFTGKWVKRFNAAGFEGLEAHGYNTWTAPRLMKKIKDEFDKEPSEQCVYDTIARLGFKHRKARPTPSKADKKGLEVFKK